MIKTRFAPSPTGFLHIGGLRTALYAYLFARQSGGSFLLRIEDTDRERFVEGGVENILSALRWGGISPDEGVVFQEDDISECGEYGPYIQSHRTDVYRRYIDELLRIEHAYHCFCTRERLDELRHTQQLNKQATGYDGLCRGLQAKETAERVKAGDRPVIRLKVPREGSTTFTDLVRGDITIENRLIDDQILLKADGFPTYHFAVVVDDHLMEVSHVIRGEEWVSSTPKHVLIYEAFGWPVPEFAHLPLIVNEQKAKLSKRHGDVSVEDFRAAGYLAEALVNFVVFLGWNPGTEKELFSLSELEQTFTLSRVGKSAAVFNREKLDWYNKQYMMKMGLRELSERAKPFFVSAGFIPRETPLETLMPIIDLERSRVRTLVELTEATAFIFAKSLEYEPPLLVWKKSTDLDARAKLASLQDLLSTISEQDWSTKVLEERILGWIESHEYGKGDVLWPFRVALSGKKNSPGPFEIAAVLGRERVQERVSAAITMLG